MSTPSRSLDPAGQSLKRRLPDSDECDSPNLASVCSAEQLPPIGQPDHLPPEELALHLLSKDRIEREHVLDLINILPREEPHSADCGSAFYTGAYRKGGIVGLRAACKRFPASTEVLARFVRQEQPSAIFSSIAILDNVPSDFHKDVANAHYDNLVQNL